MNCRLIAFHTISLSESSASPGDNVKIDKFLDLETRLVLTNLLIDPRAND